MAEHRTVDARVVGSTPISHPENENRLQIEVCFLLGLLNTKTLVAQSLILNHISGHRYLGI